MNEQKELAITRLELRLREFLKIKKREMFYSPMSAKREIEHVFKSYVNKEDVKNMFGAVEMDIEYKNLVIDFKKALDGQLV